MSYGSNSMSCFGSANVPTLHCFHCNLDIQQSQSEFARQLEAMCGKYVLFRYHLAYTEQKCTECETGTKMPQIVQQVSRNLAFQIFIPVMPCLCSFFLIFLDRLVLDLQISTVCPTVPTVCHVSGLQMSPRCIAFIATWIFNSPRVNLQDSWRQCVGNTYCFVTILRILNRNAFASFWSFCTDLSLMSARFWVCQCRQKIWQFGT